MQGMTEDKKANALKQLFRGSPRGAIAENILAKNSNISD